jgi:hypothetical protein
MKAGDRVVLLTKEWSFDRPYQVLVVRDVIHDGEMFTADNPLAQSQAFGGWVYTTSNCVPEELFDSPLYNALK